MPNMNLKNFFATLLAVLGLAFGGVAIAGDKDKPGDGDSGPYGDDTY